MKPYLILTTLLVALLLGCASPNAGGEGSRSTVTQKLNQIQIGMSSGEVVTLIGEPDRVNRMRTASGTQDQWVYGTRTLNLNVRGLGSAMAAAFGEGMTDKKEEFIYLNFENGKLVSTQGF